MILHSYVKEPEGTLKCHGLIPGQPILSQLHTLRPMTQGYQIIDNAEELGYSDAII